MIKLDTKNWKVKTDCKTVGEFLTEASAFGLSVRVLIDEGFQYIFEGGQKVNVDDDTLLDKVYFDNADYLFNDRASFRVYTKSKPNTVKKNGWVAIFNDRGRWMTNCFVFDSKEAAIRNWNGIQEPIVAKIEWEEVEK